MLARCVLSAFFLSDIVLLSISLETGENQECSIVSSNLTGSLSEAVFWLPDFVDLFRFGSFGRSFLDDVCCLPCVSRLCSSVVSIGTWIFYAVSNFLPGSIGSVQLEAASVRNMGAYSPQSICWNRKHHLEWPLSSCAAVPGGI